jgi:hypothetical protein
LYNYVPFRAFPPEALHLKRVILVLRNDDNFVQKLPNGWAKYAR